MKALVTGSSGFLGSHIIDALRAMKVDVVAYDLRMPHRDDLQVVVGDITNREKLAEAAKGCDLIFHNAAIANIDDTQKAPVRTMEVNVVGTVNALEAARATGVKRFIYASSLYVSSNEGSFYRVSKVTGELLCETYEKEYGVPYTILRYGSLYGRRSNTWNMVYNICSNLFTTGEYSYYGSGEEMREFINVEDAARETVRAATAEEYRNKIVMISGHQRMKMKDFFTMVCEIFPEKVHVNYLNANHRHYFITPYKYRRELPARINMSNYIDIGEGILACLEEVEKDLEKERGTAEPGDRK